ncbi:DUF4225 domain-containing protein [Serratia sp. UGAL515B_01]|uniref:DUF4225 domain-containing protein n=1 Tax=Serratia sp. UGAL515B_01 TaxID=2986763 RepID=UPI00295394CB|nr:DUF4225 domain-containing protein [Serratia sp. UGAL515B_01]WON76811.1 DUF4225 domain-containing protein [Serratia sp. UGAL515B_01]
MDESLLSIMRTGRRNQGWAEAMINLEARKLISTANKLSSLHLQDAMTRMNFVEEIKQVIERQFLTARSAKTDEECIACVTALRAENESLEEQSNMLRMKTAQLYAKVEFIRENNIIVGYVISAVKVVVSGMAIVGGGMMIATGTPIGVLAGAILIADGVNQISKEIINLTKMDNSKSEGIIADQTMEIAKFIGFRPESGLAVYNSVSLAASIYSIAGLMRKPEAWRLFRYIKSDFHRKVTTMSKPKLTMKIVGFGISAKVIFDLTSTDSGNS